MLFSSLDFILFFFPVSLVLYRLSVRFCCVKTQHITLLLASIVFYGWWDPTLIPLLATSVIVNYCLGIVLASERNCGANTLRKKGKLALGLLFNLGILFYFKYLLFFVGTLIHLGLRLPMPGDIVLPLAISFFTFQQIAYLVDIYKGCNPESSLLRYSLFVTFFPQLIAGPIIHHNEFIPQLSEARSQIWSPKVVENGFIYFVLGLGKKVLIADYFARVSDVGFTMDTQLSVLDAWVTALAYSMQIYFDFSGYSDMALGLALLLGFQVPINFYSPYKSKSIKDFWRRWHISLSSFLRDYIYIPMGGNRQGEMRTHFNLVSTFLIGGLWHGASWMFVIWGGIHGLSLSIQNAFERAQWFKLPTWLSHVLTFYVVVNSWVIFRADNLAIASNILSSMNALRILSHKGSWFGVSVFSSQELCKSTICLLMAILVVMTMSNTHEVVKQGEKSKWLIFCAILLPISIVACSSRQLNFLYFNF